MKYVADGSVDIYFTNDVKYKEHMLRCLNEKLMYDVIEPILSNEDKSPVDYILTVYKHDEESVSEYYAKRYRKSIEVDKITRCKDCKYYTSMIPNKNTGICSLASRHLGDYGFCSEGEGREDE